MQRPSLAALAKRSPARAAFTRPMPAGAVGPGPRGLDIRHRRLPGNEVPLHGRDGRMSAMTINGERLWQSLMALAQIGATPKGGNARLALTALDGQARDLV